MMEKRKSVFSYLWNFGLNDKGPNGQKAESKGPNWTKGRIDIGPNWTKDRMEKKFLKSMHHDDSEHKIRKV